MEESLFRSLLLGPVREPAVTVVIDVSASMYQQLKLIQFGVRRWLETCSRSPFSPPKVNLVAIGEFSTRWRTTVTQLTPENFGEVSEWLGDLQCSGSSCNLADGLQLVLADANSRAVYFITDGFPNTDRASANQILSELIKWNRMAQPVHIVVVNSAEDIANDKKFSEMRASWLGGADLSKSGSLAVDATGSGKSLLIGIAQSTLGSIRHVSMPSQSRQIQTPHATVLVNFPSSTQPHSSSTCSMSSTNMFQTVQPSDSAGLGAMTMSASSQILSSFPITSSPTTGWTGMSTSPSRLHDVPRVPGQSALGVSLHPTESLLGRFVRSDYMQGLQVLALNHEEGVYRSGRIVQEVDAEQFLIRFGDAEVGGKDVESEVLPQATHLCDFLTLLDALEQPVDITDRVLALQGTSDYGSDVYLPGTVLKVLETTLNGRHEVNVLVAFHGGEMEALPAHKVVKISASRYLRAVAALADSQNSFASMQHLRWFGVPDFVGNGTYAGMTGNRALPPAEPRPLPVQTLAEKSGRQTKDLTSTATAHDAPDSVSGDGGEVGDEEEFGRLSGGNSQSSLAHNGTVNVPTGGQWWPKERLSSGRVLNVSTDFQDGFEAGFAAAQQIMANTRQQKTYRPPGPESILKSWHAKQEDKKKKAEYRQGTGWQYSTKPRPSPGRSTTLETPLTVVMKSSLQGRPHTAPTQLMDDGAFDAYHKKQGKVHTPSHTADDAWEVGTRRVDARRHREEQRQEATSLMDSTAHLRLTSRVQATREKEKHRRQQLETSRMEDDRRRNRPGVRQVTLPLVEEGEGQPWQSRQITARQLRDQRRQHLQQQAEEAVRERAEKRQEAKTSNAAALLKAQEQRKSEAERAAVSRQDRLKERSSARREKELAVRRKEERQVDLEDHLSQNSEQTWRNKNFT